MTRSVTAVGRQRGTGAPWSSPPSREAQGQPKPIMLGNLLYRRTRTWLHAEDAAYEALGALGKRVGTTVAATLDSCVQLGFRVCHERETASKHNEEHDTERPNVGAEPRIILPSYHFWCHVRGCTAEDLETCVTCLHLTCKPEVYDLYGVGGTVQEYILQFDVAMHNQAFVAKLKTLADLCKEAPRVVLRKPCRWLSSEQLPQRASIDKLTNNVEVQCRFKALEGPYDAIVL